MSSTTGTNLSNKTHLDFTSMAQTSPSNQHSNTTTTPLNVDPVTTVFPDVEEQHSPVVQKKKSKKKKTSKSAVKRKSSLTSEKKPPKPKKGE
jgi:hypothetical protein